MNLLEILDYSGYLAFLKFGPSKQETANLHSALEIQAPQNLYLQPLGGLKVYVDLASSIWPYPLVIVCQLRLQICGVVMIRRSA